MSLKGVMISGKGECKKPQTGVAQNYSIPE